MIARAGYLMLIVAAALVGAVGCGDADSSDQPPRKAVPRAKPAASKPASTTAPAVPLESIVGELIMTKLVGPTASVEELQAVRSLGVGSIILFGPSVVDEAQLTTLLTTLRAARRANATRAGLSPELLVSVDQEGGSIRNVPFAPPELTQPQLAANGSVAAARDTARATGAALRRLGINMDLGPVSDLVQQPNRTMAGRSFGSDPAAVAPFVRATVEGMERGGIAATAKHFPGFGASTANSDEAIAYVDRTRAQLDAAELVPFRAAIDAGVDAIMVSHGVHRELGSTRPGTLDPKIATQLLRDDLGYDGVAMTDSMNARGFRDAWGGTIPKACPVAVAAGIDLLLLTGTIETARLCRQRILDAVRDGSLAESRVREAAARITELRERLAG